MPRVLRIGVIGELPSAATTNNSTDFTVPRGAGASCWQSESEAMGAESAASFSEARYALPGGVGVLYGK